MRKNKQVKERINLRHSNILLYLNFFILILNLLLGGYNIVKSHKEITNLNYNAIKSHIDLVKELPLFEVQYLETQYFVLNSIIDNNVSLDSVYANPLKNYFLVKNEIYELSKNMSHFTTIVALAIKQVGGSMATNVMIEYNNIISREGLDYGLTTNDDIASLVDVDKDIAGNIIEKRKQVIRYGDIPTGRGLIIPLLVLDTYYGDTIEHISYENQELVAKTNSNIFIPIRLSFGNVYNDNRKELIIRKINNSIITTSLYFNIRG